MMKKILIFLAAAALLVCAASCEEKVDPNQPYAVKIALTDDNGPFAKSGIKVALKGSAEYEASTDAAGIASFNVPVGVYSASCSFSEASEGSVLNYNGVNSGIVVKADSENSFNLPLTVSKSNQLVIKEVYTDGCQKDDASGAFSNDKYLIIYNNSAFEVDASDICIGMSVPANAHATNNFYTDNVCSYTEWVPIGYGYWYFNTKVTIPAYSQIVVSIFGAVNHTETYKNSVDLSKADYVMYDKDSGFNLASYYPAPDASIPESHYMKACKWGTGTAWVIGNFSPALILFKVPSSTPAQFGLDEANQDATLGKATVAVKVPNASIIDGAETFHYSNLAKSKKRLTPAVDAGSIAYVDKYGYTVYRNVNKEATEALPENEGKLVYDYAGGTADIEGGSTDPSGIDAEASIKKGAHIIYMDTNNTTNDFHMRKVASIK